MASIKQKITRGTVKAHRKVFGKPKEVMVTTSRGGLTRSEIKDVLQTLTTARKQGKLSPLTFEFRPPIPILSSREPLFLIPKDGNVRKARLAIREIITERFGGAFVVDGANAKPRQEKISRSSGQSITAKRPRIT